VPQLSGFDLLLTDPPYGINLNTSESGNKNRQQFAAIHDDDKLFDPTEWLLYRDVILWGANHFCQGIPPLEGQWYFWDKTLQNNQCRIAEGEFAWHKKGTKPRAFRHLWSGAYRASEAGEKSQHPTQKPVELMRWCLNLTDATTVLDPFAGTGPTGRACKDLGKQCVLIEREEKYCEIAARRMGQEVLPLEASA
jgi:site-specific DNA-methyltransferase (adenine-specific)